jgi:hypothetical protein
MDVTLEHDDGSYQTFPARIIYDGSISIIKAISHFDDYLENTG